MSAKSMLRAGAASPRAIKSILRRPPPLALSHNFTTAGLAVPRSPHVHFPTSAGLTATFSTHSPNSYDRGAIVVSPNPLELPVWGSRIFSPRSETFAKQPSSADSEELTPKFKTFNPPILSLSSPDEFNKPRSPTTRAGACFHAIVSKPMIRPVSGLGDAITAYPRSPYPSAPTSPSPAMLADAGVENEQELTGRVWSRTKTIYGSNPSRVSRVTLEGAPKAKKVPPALTLIGLTAETHGSSPLKQDFLSPVQEQRTATVANTNASLTHAFWQSMSLEETADMRSPLITTDDPVDSGLFSPGGMISPMIFFATKEGVVWSPPRKDSLSKKGLMDSAVKSDSPRAMVLSPSPEDPFSAFPSFSAVLSLDHGMEDSIIAYPPPAVTAGLGFER